MTGIPPSYKITFVAGDTLKLNFIVMDADLDDPTAPPVARDLTGWTALSQVRQSPTSDVILATWDIQPLDDSGLISMKIPGPETQDWAPFREVVSDIQLTDPSGDVETILSLALDAVQDITRE